MKEPTIIKPQDGYQMKCLTNSADILISGASAGVGKTFALLLEPLRHLYVESFEAVTFRRTREQIKNAGGLLDASKKVYGKIPTMRLNQTDLTYKQPQGAKITLRHLDPHTYENDWQGAEICLLAFDELTHFNEDEFFYLLSRNRSTCGVKPYVRATCNPDPDSWVARLIAWWIGEDGFPIAERDGQLRYFFRHGEAMFWGDSKQEVYDSCTHIIEEIATKTKCDWNDLIKSVSFISGSIYDNKKLMQENPEYLANLHSQSEEIRRRLLEGNWKHGAKDTDIINAQKFQDIFTNSFVKRTGKRYITADIALQGKDKFVIMCWDGKVLIDIRIIPKSDGANVEAEILDMAQKWSVPQSRITYDADGVGAFLKGYIRNALPFHNGRKPVAEKAGNNRYNHLKSQCYFHFGYAVNNDEYYIDISVQLKMHKGKSVRTHLTEERKVAKKKLKKDYEPLSMISKQEQKAILGNSPDFLDCIVMREYFDLLGL